MSTDNSSSAKTLASYKRPSPVDGMKIEDILSPKPSVVMFNDNNITIMPMADEAFINVMDDIDTIMQKIREVVASVGAVTGTEASFYDPAIWVMVLPTVASGLIPSITRVVSASLGLEEEFTKTIPMSYKIQLLIEIMKVERSVEIGKNLSELRNMFGFTPKVPTTQE